VVPGLDADLGRWEADRDHVTQPMAWLAKKSRGVEVSVLYRASDVFMEVEASVVWPDGVVKRQVVWRFENAPRFPFVSVAFPAVRTNVTADRVSFVDREKRALAEVKR
jgi:hypothetical protein